MSEWGVGYTIGIVTGLAIGLIATRKRKPWAELNEKEKKTRIGIMTIIGISVMVGISALLVVI